MNERCKNCKISRSFEDGALGPKSSLTTEQSLERIKSIEANKKKNPKRNLENMQEQLLEEEKQPYVTEQGGIIVPASWRDDDDALSDEEYYREVNKNHENNQIQYFLQRKI